MNFIEMIRNVKQPGILFFFTFITVEFRRVTLLTSDSCWSRQSAISKNCKRSNLARNTKSLVNLVFPI